MIQIKNLAKAYGSIIALKDINLWVPQGELIAFLGPNGSGKTTIIRILTGITRSSSGKVWLDGYDIETHPLAAKRICGVVHQQLNLDGDLTVEENLDIHGRLFGLNFVRRRLRIAELLCFSEMIDRRKSLVRELSGGMKRRLMIMRALIHEPRILFLDEPTIGLDVAIRRRIWGLIRRININGTTVLLTTHYVEEAEFLAHRVAFINQGCIVALDSPQNFITNYSGQWAVDSLFGNEIQTYYFNSQEEAKQFFASNSTNFMLRRVNLEDSFLTLTKKNKG